MWHTPDEFFIFHLAQRNPEATINSGVLREARWSIISPSDFVIPQTARNIGVGDDFRSTMGNDGKNGLRHEQLWNRMSVASRGALNAVDKNEFVECFPQFTLKEKERLFVIYTRVVAKMQENVMLDFKARCEAWELKEVLEELEELIEQHREGGGLSFRSAPLTDEVREMTTKIKQEEVDRLKLLVPKEEELVAQLKLQREALQAKAREEPTAIATYLAKVRQERVELLMTSGNVVDKMD